MTRAAVMLAAMVLAGCSQGDGKADGGSAMESNSPETAMAAGIEASVSDVAAARAASAAPLPEPAPAPDAGP